MIPATPTGGVRTRPNGAEQDLRLAQRLLRDDPEAAAAIAEGVAERDERRAAAYALAALARYESGQVDRRMLALLDEAVRLVETAPDRDARRWIARLSEVVERSRDAARAGPRVATWLAACAGKVRKSDAPKEETAWLTFLAERDCAEALLAAGGGPELPKVHRVARLAWYSVLALLAEGLTAAAIARRLGISPRTVHHHLEHLYRKLGTSDRLATVLRAKALGLL